MTSPKAPLSDLKAFAERGEAIYREKCQKEFEANHLGKFVVRGSSNAQVDWLFQ
ncbi:MAG: hypothetical protein HY238_06915 [Acidobacteria bacterium]|nr:hypothetical protein [Acidobacteriota bacterium]